MNDKLLEYIFRRMISQYTEDALRTMIEANEIMIEMQRRIEDLEEKIEQL